MLSSGTIFISLVMHFGINIKTRINTTRYSVNPALEDISSKTVTIIVITYYYVLLLLYVYIWLSLV